MKEPLKLPFVFLFILLCVGVVLSALTLFAWWGLTDSALRPFGLTYIVQRLPQAAFQVIIPSVVVSIVLLGFRMARRPFSRLLGFLIVLAAGYILLVNGMLWFSAMAGKARPAPQAAREYLQPRTFLRVGSVFLAPWSIADDRLSGVLLYDPGAEAPRLTVYPQGSAAAQGGQLTVRLVGQAPRDVSGSPDAARSSVFAPDRLTALFLRDISTLTKDFQGLMGSDLPGFFAASFALVFLCAASLALLRLTRWPLANIMLLIIAVRGYFLLYHVLATRFTAAVAEAVNDPLMARLFPSASFLVLGVLLLLVDILFIPADRWARGEPA
ncbi:MAG: hypothetical protein ABSG17_09220 [Spirochaetia bacterium]